MSNSSEPVEYVDVGEVHRRKFGINVISAVVFLALGLGSLIGGLALYQFLGLDPKLCIAVVVAGGGFAGFVALSPRIADQWERAVVLRLGRYKAISGPGLFWVIPFVDSVTMWIDLRIRPTTFNAEKTLTKDTVPVDVDAVLFWSVKEPERAALEVVDYAAAVSWAAQTALRDIIGKTDLAEMLQGREVIDHQLQALIESHTRDWGIVVKSVEIRDVMIPPGLEDAMSRRAQAEREKQARVILSQAEVEIAEKFELASKVYANNPTAFQLRAMNIMYEGIKEGGSLMIVPTTLADSMSAGSLAGLATLGGQKLKQDKNS